MLNRVEAYIRKEGLLNKEGLYIVALSGGADSVALLLILKQLGYAISDFVVRSLTATKHLSVSSVKNRMSQSIGYISTLVPMLPYIN